MALPETYTIPELELTPEEDGRVRVAIDPSLYTLITRAEARVILRLLALSAPMWLSDD